jgi:hypothetical protein
LTFHHGTNSTIGTFKIRQIRANLLGDELFQVALKNVLSVQDTLSLQRSIFASSLIVSENVNLLFKYNIDSSISKVIFISFPYQKVQ